MQCSSIWWIWVLWKPNVHLSPAWPRARVHLSTLGNANQSSTDFYKQLLWTAVICSSLSYNFIKTWPDSRCLYLGTAIWDFPASQSYNLNLGFPKSFFPDDGDWQGMRIPRRKAQIGPRTRSLLVTKPGDSHETKHQNEDWKRSARSCQHYSPLIHKNFADALSISRMTEKFDMNANRLKIRNLEPWDGLNN